MLRALPISVACVAALAGCEAHGQSPPDAYECGANSAEDHGRLVDGSARTEKIAGATLVVRGDGTRSAITDQEGMFTLCVLTTVSYSADVDPPGDWMGGVFFQSGILGNTQLMTFTVTELTAVLAAAGQTYDPATGIVIAINGDSPTLTGPHGAPLKPTSMGWGDGPSSGVVMFPNAPPGMQQVEGVQVQVTAGAIVWVDIRPPPI